MNFPERFLDGEPFRISHDAVRPGEVTQYNAVPWQADFLYCRWEETRGPMLKRLGWWPAQRPDDVFKSGLAAARAADDSLRGDCRSLDRYAQEVEQEYADYLLDRAEYYVRERRWANSPFWRRRQAATASEFRRMS